MASQSKLTAAVQSANAVIASKILANSNKANNKKNRVAKRLKIKPISLVIFTLFAQPIILAKQAAAEEMLSLRLSQQLSTPLQIEKAAANNSNLILADASAEAEQPSTIPSMPIPSTPSQYGLSKKTLLAAEATDANPAGLSAGAKENAKALSKDKGKNTLPFDTKSTDPKAVDLQLKDITVRAKRFYQIGPLPGLGLTKEEIPGNVQSITAKEIKESHALSLTDLMNSKLQSVNVNDYQSNPFQMDVTYRGFTASPQLGTAQGLSVFLDGIRVNEPFGDVVNWDMIPLNALNGLDVFPGSNPIFGLGTLGGAISMRTKSGFDANEGTVEASGGSFNRKQFQGSIGGNNGVIAGFAAANIFNEDGWRDNSPSKVNQLFGKAEWRNENLQLGLSGLYAGNDLIGNGMLPSELAAQDRSQVFTSPDETKNKLLQFQLTGQWDVSDTFNITGQVYKRKSKRKSSTGDVNTEFGGGVTRRPNPGELISPYYSDLDNDGLPDLDINSANIANVAMDQRGLLFDEDGDLSAVSLGFLPSLDQDGNPALDENGNILLFEQFAENPAFDPTRLAVGSNANTAYVFATAPIVAQGTETYTDANGNTATRPVWGLQAASSIPAYSAEWYQKALALWNRRSEINTITQRAQALFPVGSVEFVDTSDVASGFSVAYLDANGFVVGGSSVITVPRDANGNPLLISFPGSQYGIGNPAGALVRDPVTGQAIQRDGADDIFVGDKAGYACDVNGENCTPTALITETEIDQVTDGGAIQFNWNLEKHKFMIGASIDASEATYQSGQYLGLLDKKRNAYLAPDKIGYEYAAASNKLGLNDFGGNSITKSLYFSETWTPIKELNITGAARYNQTKVKNTLAISNLVGLAGPNAFLNFYQPAVLCNDTNGDGSIDSTTECPSGEILPFTLERAGGLGAIGPGETEKFSYYSFNPSFGATWQPNESLNLYGNWSQGARTPSVIELGCAYDDSPALIGVDPVTGAPMYGPRSLVERRFCSLPSTLSGDPYLKQVRSTTMEIGARGYLTPDVQWNISVYNTDLKDDIYFVSYTPERSFFTNIGNTRRRGLEMGVQGKAGKSTFRLNYSLTDATFENGFLMASPNNSTAGTILGRTLNSSFQQISVKPGDRIPGIPLQNLNASFNYELTQDWNIGLSAILHSSAFVRGNENNKHKAGAANPYVGGCNTIVTDENGLQTGSNCATTIARPAFRDGGKTAGYAVFNFNTSYKITKGLTAGLQISNLFDRQYQSAGRLGLNPFSPSVNGLVGSNGFNYNSNDWRSSTFLAPGAPRAGFVSLTYDFDIGK